MKTQPADGKEFVLAMAEKAVLNKMVSQNPLVIIDAIMLDNKKIATKQYAILYKEDIQTIDVLDGKKAILIYGNKGKNGLILVTRKMKEKKYLKFFLRHDKKN